MSKLTQYTINGLTWIGKTTEGEYVQALKDGRSSHDIYQPVHKSQTADNQHYITCVGCYTPETIKPLGKRDRAFLEDAYEADLSYCLECSIAHDTDDCYNREYQWTENGLVCNACFESYLTRNKYALDDYVNKGDQCIPLEAAETLAKQRRLKHVERFIGGMVDGRGGWWNGEACREGHPEQVLADLLKANPNNEYVFSHDESGQFQTYFSVWQVMPAKAKRITKPRKTASKRKAG